jgi:hypothetical protein
MLGGINAGADYTNLISSLKQNLSAVDSPVILFGGSYVGTKSITNHNTDDVAREAALILEAGAPTDVSNPH